MIDIRLPDDVGAKKTVAELRREWGKHLKAYLAALYVYGGRVATLAQRKCPVDTGYLRRSAYVTHPSHSQATLYVVDVGFYAPYAQSVHDNVRGVRFRRGESHYLTKAAAELAPDSGRFIASKIGSFIKSGIGVDGVKLPHPTGPLIGPQIHPRVLRRRARQIRAQRGDRDRFARAQRHE
jgi:hypothetical protein